MASLDKCYDELKNYLESNNFKTFTDDILLTYFKLLSIYTKPYKLLAIYKLLRRLLKNSDNVDITGFTKVRAFLASKNKLESVSQPEKEKLLTVDQLNKFIECAPDDQHLFNKVVAVFAMSGDCNWDDIMNLEVTDVVNYGSEVVVRVKRDNKKFVLPRKYYILYKEFARLRPVQSNLKFFYTKSKEPSNDFLQVNDFAEVPIIIAKFLKLPHSQSYKGFCTYSNDSKNNQKKHPNEPKKAVEVVMNVEAKKNDDYKGDVAFGEYVAKIFNQLPDDEVKSLKNQIDNMVDKQLVKHLEKLPATSHLVKEEVTEDISSDYSNSNESNKINIRKRLHSEEPADSVEGTCSKKATCKTTDKLESGLETTIEILPVGVIETAELKNEKFDENILLNEIDIMVQDFRSEYMGNSLPSEMTSKPEFNSTVISLLSSDSEDDILLGNKPVETKSFKKKPCKHKSVPSDKNSFFCEKISLTRQHEIYTHYSNLKTFMQQKTFIQDLIKINPTIKSKKNVTFSCYLPNCDDVVKVCQGFFIYTLGIDFLSLGAVVRELWKLEMKKSEKINIDKCSERIRKLITIAGKNETINFEDHNNVNKTEVISVNAKPSVGIDDYVKWSCKIEQLIDKGCQKMHLKPIDLVICKEFFDKLPKLDFHICRSETNKVYLEKACESKLKMMKMFWAWLDRTKIQGSQRSVVFQDAWERENLSIFEPRHEVCSICDRFKNNDIPKNDYLLHIDRKYEAQDAVRKVIASMYKKDVLVINVDIQTVLPCPSLETTKQFFEQKLNIYNFIVYCYQTQNVDLYTWLETDGGAGQNEFTSCLISYLEKRKLHRTKVVIVSDSCSYHNRNRILSSALLNFSKKNSIIIEQIILEKGHSLTENMNDTLLGLENQLRPDICTPQEYLTRFLRARPNKPFKLHSIDYTFFKNYKSVCVLDTIKASADLDLDTICGFLYKNGKVFYKIRHPEEWKLLSDEVRVNDNIIKNLYRKPREISKAKYSSLMNLKQYMHSDYHYFYDSLSHMWYPDY